MTWKGFKAEVLVMYWCGHFEFQIEYVGACPVSLDSLNTFIFIRLGLVRTSSGPASVASRVSHLSFQAINLRALMG